MSATESNRLREALSRAEQQKSAIEGELLKANRERMELVEQLTAANRQTSELSEEIGNVRREAGQQLGAITRLNGEREELMRDKADLASRVIFFNQRLCNR